MNNTYNQQLKFGYSWSDLYDESKLGNLDAEFLSWLRVRDDSLYQLLLSLRLKNGGGGKFETSHMILNLAPYLEAFLGELFSIEDEIKKLTEGEVGLDITAVCKRDFISRRVKGRFTQEEIADFDQGLIAKKLTAYLGQHFDALIFSSKVMEWLRSPELYQDELEAAYKFSALELQSHELNKSWLFELPHVTDYQNLVDTSLKGNIKRQGFDLTDKGVSSEKAHLESKYCLGCHVRGKDTCSTGMSKNDVVEKNPLGVQLSGCPLGQKISEMNVLRADGFVLGALATAMIDNPMVAATGHRICNDCEKSCIFQKQTPVEIPAIESQTFEAILRLPYGFEIISLLSRWNPLNIDNPIALAESGYNVLVVGMGPAGFTASHYLMNQGHRVVGIDGLKIEPLDQELLDTSIPIKNYAVLEEKLSSRKSWGFGGVAEYGITSRWDKNYLKVIRLMLERRSRFKLYDGIRLGSNITTDQAFAMGFDHIVMAMGAGDPNVIKIENMLSPGVKMASDFLMSLNLGAPYKQGSMTNLTVRMPIVVIGGGLTAIDAASEALAYYPEQIKKVAAYVEDLKSQGVYEKFRESLSALDLEILDEFLERSYNLERDPEFLSSLGGSKVIYRKSLQESPAYKLNHTEVEMALREGVEFVDNKSPARIEVDEWGYARGITTETGDFIPAKTIIIAAGTHPNTIIASEDKSIRFPVGKAGPSVLLNQGSLSYLGDMHPYYSGSVVRAMASAKFGVPEIDRAMRESSPKQISDLTDVLDRELLSHVVSVERLTPKIIEIKINSPMAARNFQPGQFFRLQNYDSRIPQFEPIALTGAEVNGDVISLIVLEMGGSSNLCHKLLPGERVVLMGPTGSPSEIGEDEKVLLVGGGLGNAVLFSIANAMRKNGCDVTYIAGYKSESDIFKRDCLDSVSDRIIWCVESGAEDSDIKGNVIDGIRFIKSDLKKFDRILTIGSDRMMAAVKEALFGEFKGEINKHVKLISSINSPMQCMMKGVCAQCLQRQEVDGVVKFVYSCRDQDQSMCHVDFRNLRDRLSQNNLLERITSEDLDLIGLNFHRGQA